MSYYTVVYNTDYIYWAMLYNYYFLQSLSIMDPGNDGQPARTVRDTLSRAFRPGQFFYDLSAAGVKFGVSREEVVNKIVAAAEQHFAGGFSMCVFCFLYGIYVVYY